MQNSVKKCGSDQWTGRSEHASTSLHILYLLYIFIKVLLRAIKAVGFNIGCDILWWFICLCIFFISTYMNFLANSFVVLNALVWQLLIINESSSAQQILIKHCILVSFRLLPAFGKWVSVGGTRARGPGCVPCWLCVQCWFKRMKQHSNKCIKPIFSLAFLSSS